MLREYRLIVAFVSGGIFWGKTEGIEKGRRERNSGWLEDPSLADVLGHRFIGHDERVRIDQNRWGSARSVGGSIGWAESVG